MGSELLEMLEKEARAESERILAEARARAEEIVGQARREAEEILAAARARVEHERAQARARATSTAQLRASALLLSAKDEAIRGVFEEAEEALRSVLRDPGRRRATLRSLLREATADLPAGERTTVEVSPQDALAVREACLELGLQAEVHETPQLADGVRLVSPDGRAVVENTVAGRLARARREMVARVAEILWGS